MSKIGKQDIINQSLNAYNQWKDQWRDHAKHHSKYEMKSINDFENMGIGKSVLCIANGASFQENVETIKKYQSNVDILCCDKTLGHCLDNGIIPTYCIVCDANVNYESYMEKWKDQLKDTILFMNVCANTKWSDNGNWKDRYFFVNMDVLHSEKEFSELSGCKNLIAAGTNVSNCLVVFLTQCDNNKPNNFFGYDKILLIGFDYSWEAGGNYYSFDENAKGKHNYMRHMYFSNVAGNLAYSSQNLFFSARWLSQYIDTFHLPVIQCTKKTVLGVKHYGDLEKHMNYRFKREDSEIVRDLTENKNSLMRSLNTINKQLKNKAIEHHLNFLATL